MEEHPVYSKVRRAETDPKIHPSRFQVGPYRYGRWEATLPVGTKYEECLRPEFWSQVADMLKPPKNVPGKAWEGSVIEVRTEDHKFYAEFYVRAVKEQALHVAPLGPPVILYNDEKDNNLAKVLKALDEDLKKQTELAISEAEVPKQVSNSDRLLTKWNVGSRCFDVIRQSDQEVVGKGFKIKEDALEWIAENKA
jgi:hypothetical protein